LTTLDFNITTPSPYRFLERFTKVINADTPLFNLARYLIELPLIEYRMLKYSPSLLSAAALFVA
jgi:cyclin B